MNTTAKQQKEEEVRKRKKREGEAFSSLLMSISRPQQLGCDPLKASLSRALVVDLSSADLRLSCAALYFPSFLDSILREPRFQPVDGTRRRWMTSCWAEGKRPRATPFFLSRKEKKRKEPFDFIRAEWIKSKKKGSPVTVQGLAVGTLFFYMTCLWLCIHRFAIVPFFFFYLVKKKESGRVFQFIVTTALDCASSREVGRFIAGRIALYSTASERSCTSGDGCSSSIIEWEKL